MKEQTTKQRLEQLIKLVDYSYDHSFSLKVIKKFKYDLLLTFIEYRQERSKRIAYYNDSTGEFS